MFFTIISKEKNKRVFIDFYLALTIYLSMQYRKLPNLTFPKKKTKGGAATTQLNKTYVQITSWYTHILASLQSN